MAFFRICPKDGVLSVIRENFDATPLKVPSTIEQPLFVFAYDGQRAMPRGHLKYLLKGSKSLSIQPDVSPVTDVAGKRTRTIDTKFGMQILQGFLKGLGLGAPAPIEASFKGVKEVSFSFSNIERRFLDVLKLGDKLKDKEVDLENPAVNMFFDGDHQLLMINNVFASNGFTIHVERTKDTDVKVDIPLINEAIAEANAGLKVSSFNETDITFEGNAFLTFAFSCVELHLDPKTGKIIAIGKSVNHLPVHSTKSPEEVKQEVIPETTQLTETPKMLSWD